MKNLLATNLNPNPVKTPTKPAVISPIPICPYICVPIKIADIPTIIYIASFPSLFFTDDDTFRSPSVFQIIFELALNWIIYVFLNSLIFFGYKEAINESPILNLI